MTKKKQKLKAQDAKQAPVEDKRLFYAHLTYSEMPLLTLSIHPMIQEIGVLMSEYKLVGANARCIALINGILEWIKTVDKAQISTSLNHQINFINQCRSL